MPNLVEEEDENMPDLGDEEGDEQEFDSHTRAAPPTHMHRQLSPSRCSSGPASRPPGRALPPHQEQGRSQPRQPHPLPPRRAMTSSGSATPHTSSGMQTRRWRGSGSATGGTEGATAEEAIEAGAGAAAGAWGEHHRRSPRQHPPYPRSQEVRRSAQMGPKPTRSSKRRARRQAAARKRCETTPRVRMHSMATHKSRVLMPQVVMGLFLMLRKPKLFMLLMLVACTAQQVLGAGLGQSLPDYPTQVMVGGLGPRVPGFGPPVTLYPWPAVSRAGQVTTPPRGGAQPKPLATGCTHREGIFIQVIVTIGGLVLILRQ